MRNGINVMEQFLITLYSKTPALLIAIPALHNAVMLLTRWRRGHADEMAIPNVVVRFLLGCAFLIFHAGEAGWLEITLVERAAIGRTILVSFVFVEATTHWVRILNEYKRRRK